MMNVVQILLRKGINPEAFKTAWSEVMKEYPEATFQALEFKEEDILVTLKVTDDTDKAALGKFYSQKYKQALKRVEGKYRRQLGAKNSELTELRKHFNIIAAIAQSMAEKSNITYVEAKAVSGDTYNQREVGIGHMSGGVNKDNVKIAGVLNEAEQKNLAETAAEIQQLLQQLEQSYPTTTAAEQVTVAAKAIEQIENNPTLKQRAISALKAGGLKAFEEAIAHPAAKIIVAALEGWQGGQ